jgi:hypothetical protein
VGYTDGRQELCTEPVRDLVAGGSRLGGSFTGYLDPFRWSRFAAARGLPRDPEFRPRHDVFAEYVQWVFSQIGDDPGSTVDARLGQRVTGLQVDRDRWSVTSSGAANSTESYDAVVVTSPGPSTGRIAKLGDRGVGTACLDARTYWEPGRAPLGVDPRVVVVGGGGAAAAIALDVLDPNTGEGAGDVVMVAPTASLFTRGESRREQQLLVSGVVFRRILDRFESGTHVVDATGFDAAWFLELLDTRRAGALRSLGTSGMAAALDDALRLIVDAEVMSMGEADPEPLCGAQPALHVPMLAGGSQAPGFASLLCLGRMAERILWPHVACL